MLIATEKNWDAHVVHAEEVARGAGFLDLRARIMDLAAPQPGETAVDVGSGTGLLALELARMGLDVWAVDISSSMCEYLRTKAASAGAALPFIEAFADLVVSNYCFHHLADDDKLRALREAHRVLKPGGRLVFADMMFTLGVNDPRDRRVLADKVRAMVRKGPAGVARLLRNGMRVVTGRWEHPARADWWQTALMRGGFTEILVEVLDHEGGIARAVRG